jgi:hypothetical protein
VAMIVTSWRQAAAGSEPSGGMPRRCTPRDPRSAEGAQRATPRGSVSASLHVRGGGRPALPDDNRLYDHVAARNRRVQEASANLGPAARRRPRSRRGSPPDLVAIRWP